MTVCGVIAGFTLISYEIQNDFQLFSLFALVTPRILTLELVEDVSLFYSCRVSVESNIDLKCGCIDTF